MPRPISNHRLDVLLTEAGYHNAHGAFARQVNRLGRETAGLVLRYDAASVYWWLRGRTPEPHTRTMIVEVLCSRIERRISTADLGFGDRLILVPDYPAALGDSLTAVTQMWHRTAWAGDQPGVAAYTAEASISAGWRWLFDPAEPGPTGHGSRTVTDADIRLLRASTAYFLDLDRSQGGGGVRTLLAQFLQQQVTPLLHGRWSDRIGRELLATAAELTGQVGYMTYDAGDNQGLAQWYFIQALRLARAAGNRALGAHLLANMATQAVFLHRPREAVQLASAATTGAGRAPARVMARLHTTEACALAIAGQPLACAKALHAAEKAMDRAGDGPGWAGYFGPAHLAGNAVRCLRDLGRPAEALRHAALALTSAVGARTRTLHLALVATIQAEAGDLDHARHLAGDATKQAAQLRSARVEERVRAMIHAIRCRSGRPAHPTER